MKLNIPLHYDPAIATLRTCPREMKTYIYDPLPKNVCISFIYKYQNP